MPAELIQFLNEKLNISDDLEAHEKLDLTDHDLQNLQCDEPMTTIDMGPSTSSGFYD